MMESTWADLVPFAAEHAISWWRLDAKPVFVHQLIILMRLDAS
jgi:hypothetical protein